MMRVVLAWNDLRIFLAVHRCASIREASRRLGVNPSTISRRLAALERDVRTPLFDRRGVKWTLTAAGERVLELVDRFDTELTAVRRSLEALDDTLGGVVRLTYPDVVAESVTRWLQEFAPQHPGLEFQLLPSDQSLDMMGGAADICIRIADDPPPQLVGRRVAKIHGGLYASRRYCATHPEPLDDPRHNWIDWATRYKGKQALQWIDSEFPQRRVTIQADSGHAVVQGIRAGLGIGALARSVGDEDPELVCLMEAPADATTDVWVLTHPSLTDLPRIRVVLDALSVAFDVNT